MPDWIDRPYFFPTFTTVLFSSAVTIGLASTGAECPSDVLCKGGLVAKGLLAFGFLALAGWFLYAFAQADEPADRDCEAEQRASMFRFAYVFSVYCFALLLLPFTAMLRSTDEPPDAGPIRLLRACFVAPASTASSASSPAMSSPIERCPEVAATSKEVTYYPWLVSVGGVVALECGSPGAPCANRKDDGQGPNMYRVHGGFVVPFYVIVFAVVGGIVNLTRRVPEYQKRSSCHFAGTATEPAVTLLEAREFVVFQIMQFLSSPFIAMVAYYAFEPKSVTTAAVTGFFAGFATESVLLLLRGMFNGLRPETTKTAAASSATSQLHVRVTLPGGGAATSAAVQVRRLPTEAAAVVQESNPTGEVSIKNMAPGTVWVEASLTDPAGRLLKAPAQRVQLKPGETESVALALA